MEGLDNEGLEFGGLENDRLHQYRFHTTLPRSRIDPANSLGIAMN